MTWKRTEQYQGDLYALVDLDGVELSEMGAFERRPEGAGERGGGEP